MLIRFLENCGVILLYCLGAIILYGLAHLLIALSPLLIPIILLAGVVYGIYAFGKLIFNTVKKVKK